MKKHLLTIAIMVITAAAFTACSKNNTQAEIPAATQTTAAEIAEDTDVLFELKSPRMNGQEILNLQKRLLSLGFSEIGDADGYYGPLAEGVIKSIKAFSGFKPNPGDLEDAPYWEQNYARFLPDGKINRTLWDYIFNDANASFLSGISAVLKYDPDNLIETKVFEFEEEIMFDGELDGYNCINEYVYTSPADQIIKVIKYNETITRDDETTITYYFVNGASEADDTYYFIRYSVSDTVEGLYSKLETYWVNNAIFIMENGIPKPYNDSAALIELKYSILKKYFSGPPALQIGHANSLNLTNFDVLNQFHDTGNTGEWIAFTTKTTLKDFSFISVDYDYEADSWVTESILYSIAEFKPLMAFQANTNVGGGIPSRGISFTDGNTKRYFYISESGFDGSLSLTEFQLR